MGFVGCIFVTSNGGMRELFSKMERRVAVESCCFAKESVKEERVDCQRVASSSVMGKRPVFLDMDEAW